MVSGLTFVPNNRTDYLLTAFVQDEIGLVDRRLSMTLGTKMLRTNFTGRRSGAQRTTALDTGGAADRLGSVYPCGANPFRLRGEFLFLDWSPKRHEPYFARFNPNPNFAPEQLNGYEAGSVGLIGKRLYLDLTGFYNHYHDLFSEDLAGGFYRIGPGSEHYLLAGSIRHGLYGYYQRSGNRTGMETGRLLEAARIVFISAHESGKVDRTPGM